MAQWNSHISPLATFFLAPSPLKIESVQDTFREAWCRVAKMQPAPGRLMSHAIDNHVRCRVAFHVHTCS